MSKKNKTSDKKQNGNDFIADVLDSSVHWAKFDNATETKTLKQHAFFEKNYKPNFYTDEYKGNKSLCGKIMIFEDERCVNIKEIKPETLDKNKACKKCIKMYSKLLY